MHYHTERLRGVVRRILFVVLWALTVLACSFHPAFAPPTPVTTALPGVSKGEVSYRWIAPYVLSSTITVGRHSETVITWFSDTGEIVRTVVGGTGQRGCVSGPDRRTIYGLNENWQVVLQARQYVDGYFIPMGRRSETFVFQYAPTRDQTCLDIYTHGKFINTLGPFECYLGRLGRISEDGSAALLVWDSPAKKTIQVIVLGPDGQPCFRVDCDGPVYDPIAAPNGTGVLLRSNDERNRFLWYTGDGKQRFLDIDGEFEGWVPGSHKALMYRSGRYDYYHRLVDWDAGKILWEIPCPAYGKVTHVALTSEYALFAVVEMYKPEAWGGDEPVNLNGEWIQSFYAVNLADGSLEGYWRARYPRRFSEKLNGGFFAYRNDRLFYVSPEEFTELDLDEIRTQRNGWSRPSRN